MHLDASFIARFVVENRKTIEGAVLDSCYSLSKSEAYFIFLLPGNDIFAWRFQAEAQSVYLSFPVNIQTHSKNRIDLFKDFFGLKIVKMLSHPGERSFHLELENQHILFFKLHGRNANVVAVSEHESTPFRKEINTDFNWKPATVRLLSGDADETGGSIICLNRSGDKYDLSEKKENDTLAEYKRVSDAWNDHSRLALSAFHFHKNKKELLASLQARIRHFSKLIADREKRLKEIEKNKNYRHLGDLLMSNLYLVQEKAATVEVFDYLEEKNIHIPLQADKTGMENAERYYRKAKKQNIESGFLRKQLDEQYERLLELEETLQKVEQAEDHKSLRPFLELKPIKQQEEPRSVYREFSFQGYTVLVGKTASDNDELSFKVAKKNDLWLHARDVSGSHVIVKHKSGQVFPAPVIEYAAKLAAWFSKRKQDSLCPVIYTERKFIRKRKGDAPGKVVVEKENSLLVVPGLPQEEM